MAVNRDLTSNYISEITAADGIEQLLSLCVGL